MKNAFVGRTCLVSLLLSLPLVPSLAQPCKEDMTLAEIVNAGADLVKDGSPRAATDTCFKLGFGSAVFDRAEASDEERFLFEYLDAAIQAASGLDQASARPFLVRGIEVADRYLDWYAGLDKKERAQLRRVGRDRVSKIVFTLGDIHVRLKNSGDLLSRFEEVALEHPNFFSPRSVELWEKSLRSYPDYARLLTNREIAKLRHIEEGYGGHWQRFHEFLLAFEKIPNMGRYAREKRRTAQKFLPA